MSLEQNHYRILAYYFFTPIADPAGEVVRHKEFFATRDVRCRIYISHHGINGQMSASECAAEEYIAWLKSDERFREVQFKEHVYDEHVFPRCTVKVRQQLVALDQEPDLALRGEHVDGKCWQKMLRERDEDTLILDVRNEYEWRVGHFEGAELPALETFRQFPFFAKKLKEERDPEKTKVMMYCTGGIRCELYSALLKQEGFVQVYQLKGGVIQYGLEEGSVKWLGKLFVFDDRMAVPISEKEVSPAIGRCRFCQETAEVYYNCADMDCNELFLSCPCCAEQYQGCCCRECQTSPRRRPYKKGSRPKPFGRYCESEISI